MALVVVLLVVVASVSLLLELRRATCTDYGGQAVALKMGDTRQEDNGLTDDEALRMGKLVLMTYNVEMTCPPWDPG